jgi:hypothetical protein
MLKKILLVIIFATANICFLFAQRGGDCINIVAGETIANDRFIYIAGDQKAYLADPTDATKNAVAYVAVGNLIDSTIQIHYNGLHKINDATIVKSAKYLLGASGIRTVISSATKREQEVAVGMGDSLILLNIKPVIVGNLSAISTLDFPSVAALLSSDLTIPLTGAALGDVVAVGSPSLASFIITAFVSAADVVTVRVLNVGVAPIDPAALSFKVMIIK